MKAKGASLNIPLTNWLAFDTKKPHLGNGAQDREVTMAPELEQAPAGAKMTIRIVGFQPGASQEELVKLLSRLYKKSDPEKIRLALARLPLTLTRSATEEQARRIRKLLEEKGAILEIAYTGVLRAEVPKEEDAELTQEIRKETEIPVGGPVTWVKDRRSKPRIHPGFPLEPMSIKAMLVRSASLLKDNFSVLFLILLIPTGAAYLFSRALEFILLGTIQGASIAESPGTFILAVAVIALVFIVLFFLGEGALIIAISESYLGHAISLWDSYKSLQARLGGLITTMLLAWVLIIGGTILFFVPGYVMFFRFLLADKVVVLEGLKGREALRRSRELMKWRLGEGLAQRPWMRAGLALMAGALVGVVIHIGFTLVSLALGFLLPESASRVLSEALGLMAEVISTTFLSVLMVIYYYDIRVRKEGFDHKTMAKGL